VAEVRYRDNFHLRAVFSSLNHYSIFLYSSISQLAAPSSRFADHAKQLKATTSASIPARHFALNLTALHRYKITVRENFQPPVHGKEPVKPQTVGQGGWIVAPKLVGHIKKRTGVGA
jgi:hypothetical protein